MASNSTKFDDPYGFARPVQNGPAQISFPFRKNGDIATRIIQRNLIQRAGNYAPPLALGLEKDSVWPAGDPQAYQAAPDTDPVPLGIEDLVSFTRTYARIPAVQTTYPGSIYITKPDYVAPVVVNPYDSSGGGIYKGQIENFSPYSQTGGAAYYTSGSTGGIYDALTYKIYNNVKSPSATTLGYATAGTFTLTYNGSTTAALNYNETAANIASALNALSSIVSEGITVTVNTFMTSADSGVNMTFFLSKAGGAAPNYSITMDATGLTVTTSKNPVTVTNYLGSPTNQAIHLPRHLTITSHGLSTSLVLAVVFSFSNGSSSTVLYASGQWGSVNSNTIWIPNTGNSLQSVAYVGTEGGSYTPPAASTYSGGVRLVRTRVTEHFYLPGVTSGITTPADIAIPAGLQNPSDFLAAIISGTSGFQVYRSEGPEPWLEGVIYRVSITEINFDDLD